MRLATTDDPRVEMFVGNDLLAVRVNGRPANPDGRHRKVVAYVAADVGRSELADLLRGAADQLDKVRGGRGSPVTAPAQM
jgi:hypothetical protein